MPVDFETESAADALVRAGLRSDIPVVVSWIAVTIYLSIESICATLRALPPCHLAVSYAPPMEVVTDGDQRRIYEAMYDAIEPTARQNGEPFITFLTPERFATLLEGCGFTVIEDVGAKEAETRYGGGASFRSA